MGPGPLLASCAKHLQWLLALVSTDLQLREDVHFVGRGSGYGRKVSKGGSFRRCLPASAVTALLLPLPR